MIEQSDLKKIVKELSPVNLAGKDYFTKTEAAHYCCVSSSQFHEKEIETGIRPFKFMGKMVYRRSDLQRIIEGEAANQWQQSNKGAKRGNSRGR